MNTSIVKFLMQLKNASLVGLSTIRVPYNNLVLNLLELLYTSGFIQSYSVKNRKTITVFLRYSEGKPVFRDMQLLSTPSKFTYVSAKDLYRMRERKKVFVLSTSLGFKTSTVCKKLKVGGKLVFVVG
jgi:small subunit ribosomal protein S8